MARRVSVVAEPRCGRRTTFGKVHESRLDFRLPLKHIQPGAEEMLRTNGGRKGGLVDDRAARGVDEDAALLEPGEFRSAEPTACVLRQRRVDGQDIHLLKKSLQVLRVPVLVEGRHAHPECLSALRDGAADAPEPVDPERLARERHAEELPRLPPVPGAGPREGLALAQPARDGEDQGEREVGRRVREDVRRVRDEDPAGPARREVHVVDADGVARDEADPRRGREDVRRDALARRRQERVGVREKRPLRAREAPASRDDLVPGEEVRRRRFDERLADEDLHGAR